MGNEKRIQISAEPGKQDVTITRAFDAPREMVFKAFTDPSIIPQWWGPRYLTTKVEKLEVKQGGYWRFVQRDAEGKEYGFHGSIHGVEAPARIIQTFEWEGLPGHVSLEAVSFEEKNGKTIVKTHSVFQSVEDRDGMMQSGMETGLADSYERLDELFAERVAAR